MGFCAAAIRDECQEEKDCFHFLSGSFPAHRLHRFTPSREGVIICSLYNGARNNVKNITLLVAILFASALTSFANDEWSQFRGPNGTGVSETKGLPTEFGPNKNVVWKTELPPGHSSPVLTRDRIFVTAHDKDKLFVISLDRQTGKILWQKEAPRAQAGRLQNVNGPASPSPVTDGTNVYVFFQDFGMISYDAEGKERWKLPLGPFNMFYGFGASPILVDDKSDIAGRSGQSQLRI